MLSLASPDPGQAAAAGQHTTLFSQVQNSDNITHREVGKSVWNANLVVSAASTQVFGVSLSYKVVIKHLTS